MKTYVFLDGKHFGHEQRTLEGFELAEELLKKPMISLVSVLQTSCLKEQRMS